MGLDHIDLRVPYLKAAIPFYSRLLPRLGFPREEKIEGWIQFRQDKSVEGTFPFFGLTEDSRHIPNANRIAFSASSTEEVDAIALFIRELGARNIEGPEYEVENETYYAVFFEDPWGNRLEVCFRSRQSS